MTAAGAMAGVTVMMSAGVGSADTLPGRWAPFSRCPVDAPALLAADGVTAAPLCLSAGSPNGSITLGRTTATTGRSDLQFGVVSQSGAASFTVAAPSGGALVADPAQVPGGLLGLMCPSRALLVSQVCRQATDNALNNVSATVEPAGTPRDFDLVAGLGVGKPILTLPVKIHLRNPLLGSTCYIGSDSHPILLRPRNLTAPAVGSTLFDAHGAANPAGPLVSIDLSGGALGDDSFAVPGATGCGLLGLLSPAINLKSGLPSAAGNNSLVLNGASTSLGGLAIPDTHAPNAGRQFAEYWHQAAGSPAS
jgi:hypothetical protein